MWHKLDVANSDNWHAYCGETKCDKLHLPHHHLVILLWRHHDCFLFLFEKSLHNCTIMLSGDSNMTIIWRIYCDAYNPLYCDEWNPQTKVIWMFPGDFTVMPHSLVTRHNETLMMPSRSQWSLQIRATWYERGNSIVTSPGDSSHSKDHGNFTVKSSNDTHLKITIKQLKLSNIGFILNVIPLTIGGVTSTEFVWYDSCTHYYIHHGSISFASPLTFNFCTEEHFVFVP